MITNGGAGAPRYNFVQLAVTSDLAIDHSFLSSNFLVLPTLHEGAVFDLYWWSVNISVVAPIPASRPYGLPRASVQHVAFSVMRQLGFVPPHPTCRTQPRYDAEACCYP